MCNNYKRLDNINQANNYFTTPTVNIILPFIPPLSKIVCGTSRHHSDKSKCPIEAYIKEGLNKEPSVLIIEEH